MSIAPRPLMCIDFATLGPHIGPNPWVLPLGTRHVEFNVVGRPPAVPPPAHTQITPAFGAMGLDCSFGLEITLVGFSAKQIAVKLVHKAKPSRVRALSSSGAVVATASTTAAQGVPQLLVLGGGAIAKVTIQPPSNETALLEFCVL
jgi:hypothetical protein